jgi:hypothetical protein
MRRRPTPIGALRMTRWPMQDQMTIDRLGDGPAVPPVSHRAEPTDSKIRVLAPRQWWYIAPASTSPAGTEAEGPWPLPHLQRAINEGVVESTRLVWTPGMAGWEPAGHQDEFAFGFSPPPLPAA